MTIDYTTDRAVPGASQPAWGVPATPASVGWSEGKRRMRPEAAKSDAESEKSEKSEKRWVDNDD